MNIFCLVKSKKKDCTNRLRSSIDFMTRINPLIDSKSTINLKQVDSDTAYYTIQPNSELKRNSINTYHENNIEIILWGELNIGKFSVNYAQKIYSHYLTGSIDDLRKKDGSFCAVIIDNDKGIIHTFTDILGQRKPMYYEDKDYLVISSNDLPIYGSGLIHPKYENLNIYSLLAFDHSISGNSFLSNIYALQPTEYLVSQDFKCKVVHKPILKPEEKINVKDVILQNRLLEEVNSNFDKYFREVTKYSDKMFVDLTSGLDSRAILAFLVNTFIKKEIVAITYGKQSCPEAQYASLIAKRMKINHVFQDVESVSIDQFIHNLTLMAIYTNGNTDSRFAVSDKSVTKDLNVPHFGGQGAEVFGDFFYKTRSKKIIESLNLQEIGKYVQTRNFIKNYSFKDDSLEKQYNEKLQSIINLYATYSSDNGTILDMLYLFQRLSNWGSFRTRCNWDTNYFMPFLFSKTIELRYRLPTYLSMLYPIQRKWIKDYSNQLYYMSFNNNYFKKISWINDKQLGQLIVMLEKVYGRVYRNYRKTVVELHNVKDQINFKSHNNLKEDMIKDKYKDYFYDMILSQNSFSSDMFYRKDINMYLDWHFSGKKDCMPLLGKLITAEKWKELIS